MSLESYDVYFAGGIMKDHDPAAVKNKIGSLFKLQGEKLERLFSGVPIAIKKGIDMEQAVNYRVAFREAGALVDIRPAESPPPQPKPAAPEEAKAAAPGVPPPAAPPQPSGVDESLSLSAPNSFDLSDCAPVVEPRPIPDISGLDLDKPGALLDEHTSPPPMEIDIDALELDEPGVIMDETRPPAPSVIDTHELTLNPANQGSLEDCQQPVSPTPIPNIDHLQLDDQEEKISGPARFDISED